jgi:hypothetical protein
VTATRAPRARPTTDGRLALLIGLTLVIILSLGILPTLLNEQTRDWIAYDQAAGRLTTGEPLYIFKLATPDDEYYLYPPLTAAVWAVAGSPTGLLVLKLAALASAGALAWLVVPAGDRRRRWAVGLALAVVAIVAAPDLHDLILANVMAFYVGAVALSLARPGWLGSSVLGVVLAAALKPVIGPYLLWLAIRRRRDFARTAAVALGVSAVCAIAIGPGRYVEYLVALPQMSVLADLPTGNAGLSAISRQLALIAVVAAYVVTLAAAVRLDVYRAAAVAIAAGLLAQPSIGFNYGGLLLPAVVVLWVGDRFAGFVASVGVPLVTVISPPAAAVIVICLAFLSPGRQTAHATQERSRPAASGAATQ